MQLHEHLYALGQRLGRDVFDDADGFRGALDDFLDEDAATTGEINLLVDAVRLGALRSMLTTLDSGGDVLRAIEEAAARLARDRGSADLDGARWALAALGYGVGRVSDPDVQRYRSAHPPAGPVDAGPTVLPPPGGAQPPYPPATAQAGQPVQPPVQPQYSPPQQWGPPPGQPGQPGQPGPPPVPPGQPRKKSKVLPVVAAVVAVVLVAGGVTAAVVLTGGDDEPEAGGGSSSTTDGESPSTSGSTSESVDATSTDSDAVNERYAGLAGLVTTGTSACEAGTPISGETERLDCTIDAGTLQLVTYESAADLEAARTRVVDLKAGGRLEQGDAGTFYAFEKADDDGNIGEAYLYWDDDDALQSGRYDATTGTALDELVNVYESTDAALDYPRGPSSPELVDFASDWFLTSKCERIQTLVDDELEENFCDVNGPIYVYLGRFDTVRDFREYRREGLQNAKDDDRPLRTWNEKEGDPPIGALYEYTTESGSAVRYWDQPDCLCYAEAYLDNGSYDRLLNWWYTS